MSPTEQFTHDERRLAAIVFTDVVGYSSRMQSDEAGTLVLARSDLAYMGELCAQFGGEVLKSTGDGLLMCFNSVVQSVACALQIQSAFAARSADSLQHRIGIHLGDVFRAGGDVAGDGVNIASRLEARARPGTICISQSVYDAVRGKLPLQAESLGAQSFKNIAEPLTVYLVAPAGSVTLAAGKKFHYRLMAGAAIIIVVGVAAAFWLQTQAFVVTPTTAIDSTATAVSDRSIAVLPFTNMSDDKDNAFFTDGMHEDVLTSLANIHDLHVISRTSVMQYRDTAKSIRQIADELGVAYILEGSVRRVGNTVRVSGQLIKASTDEHVWARSYDRELQDVFAIQSALATEISGTLQTVLSPQDQQRLQRAPTTSTMAYDFYLEAKEIARTDANPLTAVPSRTALLESALQQDAKFALAWAELGNVHLRAFDSFDRSELRLANAKAALDQAAQLDPDAIEVATALGAYHLLRGDFPEAAAQGARLASLFPNNAGTYLFLGYQAFLQGKLEEALVNYRNARVLDPWNPDLVQAMLDILSMRRDYPAAEALLQEVAAMVPAGNTYQAYGRALIPFYARGDTRAMQALLTTLPADAWRSDSNALFALGSWACLQGDSQNLIRLWEQSGPNWLFPYGYRELSVSLALVASGQPERAQPLLEQGRDRLRALLVDQPDSVIRLFELAMTYALLGDKAAALAIKMKVDALPIRTTDEAWDDVALLAWLGDKDQALDELARRLPIGKAGLFSRNVYENRHSLFMWPLQGDTRFEALLDDPNNNAPLP